MSKRIETILIDDLDGTLAARTTTFALPRNACDRSGAFS
jgi:hypothetical protein